MLRNTYVFVLLYSLIYFCICGYGGISLFVYHVGIKENEYYLLEFLLSVARCFSSPDALKLLEHLAHIWCLYEFLFHSFMHKALGIQIRIASWTTVPRWNQQHCLFASVITPLPLSYWFISYDDVPFSECTPCNAGKGYKSSERRGRRSGGGGYQHLTNVKIISIMCSSLGNLWASLSLYQLFITTRSTRKTFTIYISVMIFETTWLRLLSIALIASSISGEWMQNRQSVPSALWSLSRSDSTLVNTGSFCASFSYASHSVCDDRRLFSTLAFIFS